MERTDQVSLAQVLEVRPGDVTAVAVEAVGVGVLPEEGVGALRRRQASNPPERGEIEPLVVWPRGVDVPVAEPAHPLQVEGLEDGIVSLIASRQRMVTCAGSAAIV